METLTESSTSFDVYGLRIRVSGDCPDVCAAVALDFAWFRVPADDDAPHVDVVIRQDVPDFEPFGALRAAFVTPRNVVYQEGDRTIIDHFGRGLSVLDRTTGRVEITGQDELFLAQVAYLYLLSRIGEHVDRRGLIRFHALGLAGRQGGVAVVMPSGGGKTTLALQALGNPDVRLVSEDTPLLDRAGFLHPFPLRIGMRAAHLERLPPGWDARVVRSGPDAKYAVEVETFADRVASEAVPLRHLVIGFRSLGRDATLEPAPRRTAVTTLVREDVVGFGFFQGMEFLLRHGVRDVLGRVDVTSTRARCCLAGLRRASVWKLTLGRDLDRNWQVLSQLLD